VQAIQQRIDGLGVGQPRLDIGELRGRNAVRRKSQPIGVGLRQNPARQSQIESDRPGHARIGIGHADVGKQANSRFRHREFVILARNAMGVE